MAVDDEPIEVIEYVEEEGGSDWSCPKCGFRPGDHLGDEEKRGQKQEHEDFHFAQELQDAGNSPVRSTALPSGSSTSGTGVKKKKRKKEEGIKAFFAPRPAGKG